ncbi:MAG TPA: hypothetical protein PLH09_12470 [Lentimicrobium sp.]|nr:hypothetical protein [Lentimicrobium sp.]
MNGEENKIYNVLIADDHQMFVDGLKALLRKEKNIQIAGEVSNGADAM